MGDAATGCVPHNPFGWRHPMLMTGVRTRAVLIEWLVYRHGAAMTGCPDDWKNIPESRRDAMRVAMGEVLDELTDLRVAHPPR